MESRISGIPNHKMEFVLPPAPRQLGHSAWPRPSPESMPLPGFRLKELEAIALTAAACHEVMRAAAKLADEAREMEKANDTVSRHPDARTGELMNKTGLLDKPEKI
jgi:hypothetical protein